MSQEINALSEQREKTVDRRTRAKARVAFLRLFEDVVDELNAAVQRRVRQGTSRAAMAKRVGLDPAVLSRVLVGRAGTNLRTVAAVLNATEHRLRVQAIPCEHLRGWGKVSEEDERQISSFIEMEHFDGIWQFPMVLRGERKVVSMPDLRTSIDALEVKTN